MKVTYKTNIDVYNELINLEDKTKVETDVLSYTEKFLKYNKNENIKKLKEKINKIHKIPEEVTVKIIDIKPAGKEELLAILSSYDLILDDKVLDSIIDILQGL